MTRFSLSIIVPAYNEAERINRSLDLIFAYLKEREGSTELIVVDDGSSDDTTSVAQRSFARADASKVDARLIRVQPNKGKGYAVRAGLLASSAPIALFTDADLSTPISETPKLIAPIESNAQDVVFGSRALDRTLIGTHQSWRREQGGRVFNMIVRLATRLPFWDTQCGFKAFRMDVCRPLVEAATIDRFGFDVELLHLAHAANLRVHEQAVRWDHYDGSKVDVARDSLRMFNEVRLIRRQAANGMYDDAIKAAQRIAAESGNSAPALASSRHSSASDTTNINAESASSFTEHLTKI